MVSWLAPSLCLVVRDIVPMIPFHGATLASVIGKKLSVFLQSDKRGTEPEVRDCRAAFIPNRPRPKRREYNDNDSW